MRPKSENRPPTAAGSRFHKVKRTRIDPQDPDHCAAPESNELIVNLLPISVAHADFHSRTTTMLPADFQSPPLCPCGKQKVQLPKHQPFGDFHRTLIFSSAGLNHVANRQSAAKPPIPPSSHCQTTADSKCRQSPVHRRRPPGANRAPAGSLFLTHAGNVYSPPVSAQARPQIVMSSGLTVSNS